MKVIKASTEDVLFIYHMIDEYAKKGIVLPRTLSSINQHLDNMYVVKDTNQVIGVAGLHVIGSDIAEIRSLVVKQNYQNKGIGRKLVNHIIKESSNFGIKRLISLTYQVEFFNKSGFNIIEKENLPEKVWIDCINCPKFNHCDEIAMIKYLTD